MHCSVCVGRKRHQACSPTREEEEELEEEEEAAAVADDDVPVEETSDADAAGRCVFFFS